MRVQRLPSLEALLGRSGPKVVRDEDMTDWHREFDERVARDLRKEPDG